MLIVGKAKQKSFRLITHTLQKAKSGTTIVLTSGGYGNGENFPLQVKANVTLKGNVAMSIVFLLFSWVSIQCQKVIKVIFKKINKFIGISPDNEQVFVLGAGEFYQRSMKDTRVFDYSQTANISDMGFLISGNYQQGDFWLGRYINFRNNQAFLDMDVWLPNQFLHQHVLIVDKTETKKAELFLTSARNLILQGNLICIDGEGLLGDRLVSLASSVGANIVFWNNTNSGKNRIVWNFLEELEKFGTEEEIRNIAITLYGTNISVRSSQDIIWLTAILALIIEARRQKICQINPSDLPDFILDRNQTQALLSQLPEAADRWGPDLLSYLSLSDQEFARDIKFIYQRVSCFKLPEVRAICDGMSNIFFLRFLNGNSRSILVLGAGLINNKSLSIVILMMTYIINVMHRRLKNINYNWLPIYIVADAGEKAKFLKIEEMMKMGKNAKISVILLSKSIEQLTKKSGTLAQTLAHNCQTQIFLSGVSRQSANWFSKQFGKYQRYSRSTKDFPVLGISEICQRPPNLMPSNFSAIVRLNWAESPTNKPFLTDYSV